jgi:hypothetical protein
MVLMVRTVLRVLMVLMVLRVLMDSWFMVLTFLTVLTVHSALCGPRPPQEVRAAAAFCAVANACADVALVATVR